MRQGRCDLNDKERERSTKGGEVRKRGRQGRWSFREGGLPRYETRKRRHPDTYCSEGGSGKEGTGDTFVREGQRERVVKKKLNIVSSDGL